MYFLILQDPTYASMPNAQRGSINVNFSQPMPDPAFQTTYSAIITKQTQVPGQMNNVPGRSTILRPNLQVSGKENNLTPLGSGCLLFFLQLKKLGKTSWEIRYEELEISSEIGKGGNIFLKNKIDYNSIWSCLHGKMES